MKRDGNLVSLWQDGLPGFRHMTGQLPGNKVFDVVIVGAGITGITTGLLLQKAGKTVLIAEAHTIGFGTTGGTTAHLNSFTESPYNRIKKDFGAENAKLVAKALRQGLELVKRNIEEYEIDCGYKELNGYLYSRNDEETEELKKILDASVEANVDAGLCTIMPMKMPFEKVIEFRRQAQFHPSRYLYALASEFEKLGGIILENCRVTEVDETETLTVTTSIGEIKAQHLIYATHIPPGVNLLHFRCAPYRSYVIAVKLKHEQDYPDALVYDMDDPYRYFRTHEVDGEKFLIAGGEDHKTGHEENTEACFARIEAFVRTYYEIEEVAYRWSSQYYDPADGLPYIGHLPGHAQNMFVATGYGGIGMSNSAIAALLLTDLILTGESEYKKIFDPNRIKPVAGFNSFVKEAADVTGQFIKSVLPKEKLEAIVDLAPGEGKVVRYEGRVVALYKDENGKLYALSPACTHIKCTVNWNASEKSWDCPCHGSRFSCEGEVLTAPARKDLQVIKLEELVEH